MKYQIINLEGETEGSVVFAVRSKSSWISRWKYVRDKKTGNILIFNKRRHAQAYINFQNNPRLKSAK